MRHVTRATIEALVKCGAYTSLGARRAQLLHVLDRAVEMGQQAQDDKRMGQMSMFGAPASSASPGAPTAAGALPDMPELPNAELLKFEKAVVLLKEWSIAVEVAVASAHRAPKRVLAYAREATGRGVKVIIAVAGIAAHLAGVLAAETTLPVIGVPMPGSHLKGLDSLLSTCRCPRVVPVATMAVGPRRPKRRHLCRPNPGSQRLETQGRLKRHKAEAGAKGVPAGGPDPFRVSPWRRIAGEGCGHDDHHHGGPGRRSDGPGVQLWPTAPSLCSPGQDAGGSQGCDTNWSYAG